MKEAFDLIRKRIGEITIDRSEEGIIRGCNMGICLDDDCLKCLKKKILSIVSEVEAEYGNDVCECKNEKGMFIQNPHTGRKFSNEPSMKNVYCNTCGKKIKVVE